MVLQGGFQFSVYIRHDVVARKDDCVLIPVDYLHFLKHMSVYTILPIASDTNHTLFQMEALSNSEHRRVLELKRTVTYSLL